MYPQASPRLLVQLVAMEGVRADPEDVSVLTGEEGLAQDPQAIRIEEMIAVDPQHPARRGGVLLQLPMRLCGVRAATDLEVIELLRKRLQDRPRPIGGDVIERVDAIAGAGRIANSPLYEDVLVAHEGDADEPDRGPGSHATSRPGVRSRTATRVSSSSSLRRRRTTSASTRAAASTA